MPPVQLVIELPGDPSLELQLAREVEPSGELEQTAGARPAVPDPAEERIGPIEDMPTTLMRAGRCVPSTGPNRRALAGGTRDAPEAGARGAPSAGAGVPVRETGVMLLEDDSWVRSPRMELWEQGCHERDVIAADGLVERSSAADGAVNPIQLVISMPRSFLAGLAAGGLLGVAMGLVWQ